MIVHGCNDFSIGILIARIRFYEHHLTEEKRNVFFRRIVLIDVEVTVLDKGKMTYQNLLQIFTGQAVPALDFLQSISLCLIEYSVSAKIIVESIIIVERVEEVIHICFRFIYGKFLFGIVFAVGIGKVICIFLCIGGVIVMPQIGSWVRGTALITAMLFVDFCEQFRFGWLRVFHQLCDLGTAGKAHEHD